MCADCRIIGEDARRRSSMQTSHSLSATPSSNICSAATLLWFCPQGKESRLSDFGEYMVRQGGEGRRGRPGGFHNHRYFLPSAMPSLSLQWTEHRRLCSVLFEPAIFPGAYWHCWGTTEVRHDISLWHFPSSPMHVGLDQYQGNTFSVHCSLRSRCLSYIKS